MLFYESLYLGIGQKIISLQLINTQSLINLKGGSMKRTLLSIGLILALAFTLSAQERPVSSKQMTVDKSLKGSYKAMFNKADMDVLWDQLDDLTGSGTASQVFPDFGDCVLQSADDFEVPMGQIWTINEVATVGSWSASGPTASVEVYIYADDGGVPGTVIYSQIGYVPGDPSDPDFVIPLSTPAELSAGYYWISVMSRMDFGGGTPGQWFWGLNAYSYGEARLLQDPCDLLGAGYTDWTNLGPEDLGFMLSGTAAIEGPGFAADPSPANGSIDVAVDGTTLAWTNPAGTSYNTLYFGTDEALVTARDASTKVLGDDATVFDSYDPGMLDYGTTYYWAVDETEVSKTPGTTFGTVWSFITEFQYPMFEWVDDFEAGLDNWVVEGVNGSFCDWELEAPPYAGAYQLPPTAGGNIVSANSDACGSGTTMDTYLTMDKGVDLSNFGNTTIEVDMDQHVLGGSLFQIDVSVDGGVTWINVYDENADARATHLSLDISDIADFQADVRIRFHYEAHGWHWWWALDNVGIMADTPLNPVTGTLMYANGNPVANAEFMIFNDTKYVFLGETDADGFYNLPEVPPGDYDFMMVSGSPEGAVNVLDAYLVSQQAMKIADYPEGHMFYVSDVDGDMEIRYQDAQMIFARIFGDIDAYERDDWYAANPTMVDFGNHIYVNLPEVLLATGDADLTYGESVKPVRTLSMQKSSVNTIPLAEEIEVPFNVGADAKVAGAMLRFNYDNTAYTFTGIKSNLNKPYVIDGDGFVSVMYLDKEVNLAAGDELLTLKFKVNEGVDVPEDFEVTLDDKSALMNKNGDLINTSLQTVTFGEVIPTKYDLAQNYPNPFNPSTKISFSLPQADVVTLKIYDILGSEVATLVNGKMEAGKYEINFDASNLPSGAYIYRIQTNNFQSTKKMMLLK